MTVHRAVKAVEETVLTGSFNSTGRGVCKRNIVLSSAEYEICPAHKC